MVRTILGIASLILMWTVCGPLNAQAKAPVAPKGAWKKPIVGRGETEETAKKDALREAAKIVTIMTKQTDPPLRFFKVDEEYVKNHLVAGPGNPGEEIKLDGFQDPFKQWVVDLKPYADWWNDLFQQERTEEIKVRAEERKLRAEERQNLMSRVMLGLSLLLLTGVGYVRLDEYTQRRYTAWLRTAGFGVATAAGAGWWWMFSP